MTKLVKPANKIVVLGEPLVEELEIKTVATMYPGRLVERDTNDSSVKAGTAAGPVMGWLGYEQAHKNYRPADKTTIYKVNDEAPVLFGGHFVIIGSLQSGQNVTKGAKLVAAAAGELLAAAAITIVASGAAHITDGQGVTGSYGVQGPVVAIARESVDASSSALPIMVESLI
jgi:hypothetical protein